jgi:hypothetical protein
MQLIFNHKSMEARISKTGYHNSMNLPERRKMERFPLELHACLASIHGADSRTDELFTKNICAGGAFIETKNQLPVGTDVTLELVLSLHTLKHLSARKSQIMVNGSVIRAGKTGMAVSFDNYKIIPYRE